MPLVYREQTGDVTLALWQIAEGPEELCARVTAADAASARGFASAARRAERLAWRALLREFVPEGEVLYDACGAPYVAECPLHIGVSHTPGLAALVLSPRRCAVDVERAGRDPGPLAVRYLSEEERRLPESGTPLFRIALWCAKETLYKCWGRPGADFRNELRITAADLMAGRLEGVVTPARPEERAISATRPGEGIPLARPEGVVTACCPEERAISAARPGEGILPAGRPVPMRMLLHDAFIVIHTL